MEIVNPTAFTLAPLPGRLGFPGHSLTFIAKATLALVPDGTAMVAEEQLFPTGDQPYPDDEEGTGAPRYESDFAPFKPGADVMLVGHCHAPGGQPVPRCEVALQVGELRARLAVVGERRWQAGMVRSGASEPRPFTRMELRPENAYGGPDYPRNPVGRGHGADRLTGPGSERALLLPCIERPDRPVTGPGEDPGPAGFGPMHRAWQDRFSLTGTYDQRWQNTRWPWFPEDFDWHHFNAAPRGLQLAGYLRGDESLAFTNLHPQHAEYRSRLPDLRLRAFVTRVGTEPEDVADTLEEVSMHLDTLWVDMDAERLVLVWRGHTRVADPDASDIAHIYLDAEPASEASLALGHYRQRFLEQLAAIEAEWAMDEEQPPEPEPDAASESEPPPPPGPEAKEAAEAEAKLQEALAELAKVAPKQDFPEPEKPPDDPEKALREALEKLRAAQQQAGIPEEHWVEVPEEPATAPVVQTNRAGWTRDAVAERLAAGEALAGEDLSELDLSGLDFSDRDLTGCVLDGADLCGARLAKATLVQASLAGTRLVRADLSAARLNAADLSGADATEAMLARADLSQCTGESLLLRNAMLAGACLNEAELSGADLGRANLRSARLDGARLDGARLAQANLDGCEGTDADFSEADLTDCSLRGAALLECEFSGARLDRCDFQDAELRGSIMEGVAAPDCDFSGARMAGFRAAEASDFRRVRLHRADASGSIWEAAVLEGADLRAACLREADFGGADLRGARLDHADAAGARFIGADLTGASLRHLNLFQGSLERANLGQVDVSGSNLYGVEFLDCQREGLHGRDVNLLMTKLAGD